MKPSRPYGQWITTFITYNLVFFILQLSYILLNNHHVTFISAIHLPPIVYLSLMGALITHLCLYVLLSLIQTACLWGIEQYQVRPHALENWHLAIWSTTVCAILTLNGYFFPLSLFSRLFLPELPKTILIALLLISLALMSVLLLNTLFFLVKKYPKKTYGVMVVTFGFIIYKAIHLAPQIPRHQITTAPNIIMIGIDSLSPRKINHRDTPTLARFVQEGVLFKETITPLANTYPAWASILTGLYPEHNQARYNLMPPDAVKSSNSIAWLLQKQGYQTLFATDDRQFNMLGRDFGFQTMIGPRGGANDFLISALNDFPLSNLLVNFPISQWLFPYNYSNRASYITYYPQSFDKRLQQLLVHHDNASPSFMAIHFTLPHWPYLWAESPPETNNPHDQSEQHHQMAVQRVDQQVSILIRLLEHYGYLDNGMIILLSDHGEGFYFKGSRQTSPLHYQGPGVSRFSKYLKRNTSTVLDRSAGHGSDLLSADQYHCLLAFKIYQQGHEITLPQVIRLIARHRPNDSVLFKHCEPTDGWPFTIKLNHIKPCTTTRASFFYGKRHDAQSITNE
jgi:arylsulfatase A-like enzyme/predicted membrane protein